MSGYLSVMISGAVMLLVLGVIGVCLAWGMARLMDRANANSQGHWSMAMSAILSQPISAAIYYGCRWIGICLLIGWLFSRPV